MGAMIPGMPKFIGKLVGEGQKAVGEPARQIIKATDTDRRAAAALRARRIGSRALLGNTLGADEEKRTTLGVG